MATPVLSRHRLDGALGEILVDVRAPRDASARPAVIVAHGFKGFKDWGMFPPFAERLARAGFTAVTYNASGSGVDEQGRFSRAERFGRNTFSAELFDLDRVLQAVASGLPEGAASSIGLVGHSRGGGIAILETARSPAVSALVTWSAISSSRRWPEETRRRWRAAGQLEIRNQRTGEVLPLYPDILDDVESNQAALDIEGKATTIRIPWLIIHGDADETVPVQEAKVLAAAAPSAELFLVERATHTYGAVHPFAGATPALERLFDRTLAFLSRQLG